MAHPISCQTILRQFCLLAALLCVSPAAVAGIEVAVRGLDSEMQNNVLALLTIEQQKAQLADNEVRLRRYFSRGRREIAQALQPFGYYRPAIKADLSRKGNDWMAVYDIDPGEPVRLRAVDVRLEGPGGEDPRLREFLKDLTLKKGDIAEHPRYEKVKRTLQSQALELGYLDAEYQTHELRIDADAGWAEISLHLVTGPRFAFGPVSFNDAGLTPELLTRYVPFEDGDAYSNRKLLELNRALSDSDYFSRVDVIPRREAATDLRIPVDIVLAPRKRQRYTAGIGFGTDTGVRGSLGWEHRRINRRGHRLGAGFKASQIQQGINLSYNFPIRNPRTDRLAIDASSRREDTDSVDSRTHALGINRTRVRDRWRENLSLTYQKEDFTVGLTDETTNLLMPAITLSRVRADNRMVASRGYRLQFDLRGAVAGLLSDTSFVQARADAKWIVPAGANGRVLARGTMGSSWVSEFRELPASQRFFAGGDQSVRGFDLDDLGPRDSSGEVVGGRHLLVGSLEYEHRIRGPWRVAAFVDTGNAFDAFDEGLETGAGVGVRWQSPVGMVRVDVAAAISESDNPLRLHITLVPDL